MKYNSFVPTTYLLQPPFPKTRSRPWTTKLETKTGRACWRRTLRPRRSPHCTPWPNRSVSNTTISTRKPRDLTNVRCSPPVWYASADTWMGFAKSVSACVDLSPVRYGRFCVRNSGGREVCTGASW